MDIQPGDPKSMYVMSHSGHPVENKDIGKLISGNVY